MKKSIECPNCGNAFLVEKKIHPGTREKKSHSEFVWECPLCKVLFHEEELEISR
jgi:ssDNA-binding Zn-finger/Zn-ribbon topoisomerase 1